MDAGDERPDEGEPRPLRDDANAIDETGAATMTAINVTETIQIMGIRCAPWGVKKQ